jgi:two-component system, OmpR family, alkaline phosphatase synthesis response regulator PhoP
LLFRLYCIFALALFFVSGEDSWIKAAGIRGLMSEKTKVLVVDDEIAVGAMMVFLLTRAGFDVEAATNTEKALRLAQSQKFNLITLDVDMPGVNGFQLLQQLRQIPQQAKTKIVFVSGNSTIENQQHAFELGAADFIEKPFGASEFVARIRSQTDAQSHLLNISDEIADANAEGFCNSTQCNQ